MQNNLFYIFIWKKKYVFEIIYLKLHARGAHTQAPKKLIGKHLVTIKIYYK